MSNDTAACSSPRRGVCLVVSAPSGAGKSSLLRLLMQAEPQLGLSVSATTRAPRPGETHGTDYWFTDRAGFDTLVEADEMLEHATVFGRSYGTPRAPVERALSEGRDVAFDIDWQGHRLLRAALPNDVVGVFILPPSMATLEQRLRDRRTDSETEINRRMQAARDETSHWNEFDHVITNHDLATTAQTVGDILRAARTTRHRQPTLPTLIANLLN